MRNQARTMSTEEYIDRCFVDRIHSDAQAMVQYDIDGYQNMLEGIKDERKTLRLVDGSNQIAFADRAGVAVTLMRDFGNQIMADPHMPWPVVMAYVKNNRFFNGWVSDLRAGSFGSQTEGALVAMEATTDNFLKGAAALSKKAGG